MLSWKDMMVNEDLFHIQFRTTSRWWTKCTGRGAYQACKKSLQSPWKENQPTLTSGFFATLAPDFVGCSWESITEKFGQWIPLKWILSGWVGECVAVPDIAKIKSKIAAYDNGIPVNDYPWGPNNNFRFPKYHGTDGIWQAVADLLPHEWFKFRHKVTGVLLLHKVTGVNIDTKLLKVEAGTQNKCSQEFKFDTLISTAPLDTLVNMIKGQDKSLEAMKDLTSNLVYSHTHVIGIGLTGQPPETLSNKSWMYFPDSDSPFYRITVFSSYSDDHVPKPGKQWSLMCEVVEPKGNSNPQYWSKEHLIDTTIQALIAYGFITPEMVVSKYYRRLDHGYPVLSISREMILGKVRPWLESKGIYSRGRFGGWRYEVANQGHSFM